ncbi:MAG: hypothetical protein JXR20_04025 [Balneola sp.]
MKKNLQRLLSFAVLATLIISCGGESNPLIKEAKDGIEAKNYGAALTSLDQAISEDPTNANAYYYKGLVYSEMAQNNPNVNGRKDSYSKMRENLNTSIEMYSQQGTKNLESVEAQLLTDRTWSREHNLGVQYAQGDSSLPQTANPLDISEDHLENAIIINPDSVLSYEVLSEVYRLNDNLDKSITTYEDMLELKSTISAYDYDRLGSLYLQTEEYKKANTILVEGIEMYPDSISLVQKLADSYMNIGENQKSIEVIRSLIERDPENPQYHLVLGTQVYVMARDINEENSAKYDEIFELERQARSLSGTEKQNAENRISTLRSEIETNMSRANELTDTSIEELNLVTELRPDDADAFSTLGIIYQNKAAALFEKRNATTDNAESSKIDDEAKDNLRDAMVNYEKAVEIRPEEQSYWRSLFQIYTLLNMNEKAEAAMEKAGM